MLLLHASAEACLTDWPRVYFSMCSTHKKMKTVGNLCVKNNGDGRSTRFKWQHRVALHILHYYICVVN